MTGLSIPPWFDCGWLIILIQPPHHGTFNPTLVRLRRGRSRTRRPPRRNFQSHLGSIAAVSPMGRAYTTYDFQSHLGSIAACSSGRPLPCSAALSIPPWFDCGAVGPLSSYHHVPTFNPTLVRLRQGPEPSAEAPSLSFNPTLVRLRLERQFLTDLLEGELSIPPWFDCGPWATKVRQQLRALSIPPWFDCGLHGQKGPRGPGELSIPPWFDCGL